MKNFLLKIAIVSFFFLLSSNVFGKAYAAFLEFDKTTVSTNTGETFQTGVVVDAGSDQISSSDVYVLYDASLLEASTVTPGQFFPTVTHNITSGKIYIAGLVDDPATYKTGSGTIGTITFKALKDGSGTLTFDCQAGVYNSSKIIKNDLNATNVIVCSQNGVVSVTVGSGVNPTNPPPQPTPTSLPKSGVFENVAKVAIPGMILVLLGVVMRLIVL
ncbi:hypothetical protein HYW87_01225 [Candidatus Roizmanbacteria bacterium]|nr:hypothetical protein [Candidatus Roizmanbacteria bacterium]